MNLPEYKNSLEKAGGRRFNGPYTGNHLDHIAFPLGGIGAGMVCMEGTGAISHVSVRNKPDMFNEPFMFAALSIKGVDNGAKVLEGPVPSRKLFGRPSTGNGAEQHNYGFPRFDHAEFQSRFPFSTLELTDTDIPLAVDVTGWSPFMPGDEDNSSLPVATLEYRFTNNSNAPIEAVFSYHSSNFMRINVSNADNMRSKFMEGDSIRPIANGFVLAQSGLADKPHYQGEFAICSPVDDIVVDHCHFRGSWFDSRTILWQNIEQGRLPDNPPTEGAHGASLYVPLKLEPGEERTIPVLFSWYVPVSDVRYAAVSNADTETRNEDCAATGCASDFYQPWYSGRFADVDEVSRYWGGSYSSLREKSSLFSRTFFSQTLPPEVLEAVAANLTILKSPTVLRQKDGRLWAWEGCKDSTGCCAGSCTHVWNYAQAIPHLFPRLERSLRETEFSVTQSVDGHQDFRAPLPILAAEPGAEAFHAAADGQMGGIMKMYREWRISADSEWLKNLWPAVKGSMDYCIATWDPAGKGIVEEPHHNTYDIEFWGPDGMCTSFYLGALHAMTRMASAIGEDYSNYSQLFDRGRQYVESTLFDGEYFYQEVVVSGLQSAGPLERDRESLMETAYASREAAELLEREGPKYQYGIGCLSDGVLGCWMATVCGLDDVLDTDKVASHLNSIYKYNFRTDLTDHANPQRPAYACGAEGGLLLCTWPKGGKPSLPFVYSDEVWTGIEYHVASHLMMMGDVEKALDIVREARKRYDGRTRNPFNEYECGHWYARAMSSYGLIQGLTGIRFDAVEQTLYIDSRIGDTFDAFLSTETGFGMAGLRAGEPYIDVRSGKIPVHRFVVAGEETHRAG